MLESISSKCTLAIWNKVMVRYCLGRINAVTFNCDMKPVKKNYRKISNIMHK